MTDEAEEPQSNLTFITLVYDQESGEVTTDHRGVDYFQTIGLLIAGLLSVISPQYDLNADDDD